MAQLLYSRVSGASERWHVDDCTGKQMAVHCNSILKLVAEDVEDPKIRRKIRPGGQEKTGKLIKHRDLGSAEAQNKLPVSHSRTRLPEATQASARDRTDELFYAGLGKLVEIGLSKTGILGISGPISGHDNTQPRAI